MLTNRRRSDSWSFPAASSTDPNGRVSMRAITPPWVRDGPGRLVHVLANGSGGLRPGHRLVLVGLRVAPRRQRRHGGDHAYGQRPQPEPDPMQVRSRPSVASSDQAPEPTKARAWAMAMLMTVNSTQPFWFQIPLGRARRWLPPP